MDVPDTRPGLWQLSMEGSFSAAIFIIVILFLLRVKCTAHKNVEAFYSLYGYPSCFPLISCSRTSLPSSKTSIRYLLTFSPLKHWLLLPMVNWKVKEKIGRMVITSEVLIAIRQDGPIIGRVQPVVKELSCTNWQRLSSHSSKNNSLRNHLHWHCMWFS